MTAVLTFVVFLGLSYLSVWALRHFAQRRAIFDVANERSSHVGSTATGGGLAIVVLMLLGVWGYALSHRIIAFPLLIAYTIPALLIAIISWLDDLYSQPNWVRFSIHSIAGLLAIYGLGYLSLGSVLPGAPRVIEWLGVAVTFLWIVGLTNAYNFMDGIDGIAGGQALVAALAWSVVGWQADQPIIVCFGLLLSATVTGFLLHNWPPARIFMGDVGSAFLGFTLAVLPLILNAQLSQPRRPAGGAVVGLLFVWPFVFDSTFTFLRRLSRGERIFSAHRSHLYQRLIIAGKSHRFVSVLYIVLAAVGAVLAVSLRIGVKNSGLAVTITVPLLCVALWLFVTRKELHNKRQLHTGVTTYADSV